MPHQNKETNETFANPTMDSRVVSYHVYNQDAFGLQETDDVCTEDTNMSQF